jgi:hypothetical protein
MLKNKTYISFLFSVIFIYIIMNITCLLPVEILSRILEFLSIRDLVRMESTNKLIQSLCLYEMERQVSRDEWGILVIKWSR